MLLLSYTHPRLTYIHAVLSSPKSPALRPLTLPARHCQPVPSGVFANIAVIYARVMQLSVTLTQAARVLVLDSTSRTQHLASDCSRIVLGYFDGWVKTWGDASRSVVASFSSRMLQLQSIIVQILEGSPLVIVWRGGRPLPRLIPLPSTDSCRVHQLCSTLSSSHLCPQASLLPSLSPLLRRCSSR